MLITIITDQRLTVSPGISANLQLSAKYLQGHITYSCTDLAMLRTHPQDPHTTSLTLLFIKLSLKLK